jgi:hypothetical protein
MSTSLQFLLALSLLIAGARLGPTLLNFFHLPWFTSEALSETVKRLASWA